jgi:SET domain-containing protein
MLTVSTYLAPSVIEGLGVFAREYIPRGRLIWTLNPKFDIFINESEIDAYPPYLQDFMSRYTYPHLEMPGVVILDSDNGRFMNHSSTPNTDFRIFDKGYALVDIAKGEELTCNYYEYDPAFSGYPAMHAVVAENSLQARGG